MKSAILVLTLLISTQTFAQAFQRTFKAERHFYSLETSCEESRIPQEVVVSLGQETHQDVLDAAKKIGCKGINNTKKHSCAFIKVDGLNEAVANHVLSEELSGMCIPSGVI